MRLSQAFFRFFLNDSTQNDASYTLFDGFESSESRQFAIMDLIERADLVHDLQIAPLKATLLTPLDYTAFA